MQEIESIKSIIMRRDNLAEQDVNELIQSAYEAFHDYLVLGDEESAYDVCSEYFGLEPDYLTEFLER
jgi:hypothetical protein